MAIFDRRGKIAVLEEAKQYIAGTAGELLIQAIPADWVAKAADKLPDSLLTDSDSRKRWSAGISLGLDLFAGLGTSHRNALQMFLEQTAEEIGKRSADLDGNGTEKDRKVIREAMDKYKATLDPLRAKKDAQGKDSDKTILQMVGEMSSEDQKKFWTLIGAVRTFLLHAQHDLTVTEFDRRLVRMTMPKAELTLFINGVTTSVDDLQRDLFIRALQQSVSAGGVAGGFVRMLDHAQGALESVTSSAGNIRPDHLAKELREGNLRRERKERVLRRIR